jgi:hypothetical protein
VALWRYNLWQRQTTTHYATMVSSASDGKQCFATLQQWQVTAVEIFVFCFLFFYLTVSRKKKRARKRERREIQNLFPDSIGWHNSSSFL